MLHELGVVVAALLAQVAVVPQPVQELPRLLHLVADLVVVQRVGEVPHQPRAHLRVGAGRGRGLLGAVAGDSVRHGVAEPGRGLLDHDGVGGVHHLAGKQRHVVLEVVDHEEEGTVSDKLLLPHDCPDPDHHGGGGGGLGSLLVDLNRGLVDAIIHVEREVADAAEVGPGAEQIGHPHPRHLLLEIGLVLHVKLRDGDGHVHRRLVPDVRDLDIDEAGGDGGVGLGSGQHDHHPHGLVRVGQLQDVQTVVPVLQEAHLGLHRHEARVHVTGHRGVEHTHLGVLRIECGLPLS